MPLKAEQKQLCRWEDREELCSMGKKIANKKVRTDEK